MKPDRPLRVLFWSPAGAGHNYHGPGKFAAALARAVIAEGGSVEVAHGVPDHRPLEGAKAIFVASFQKGRFNLRFLVAGARWMSRNVDRFDLVQGVSAFIPTLIPMAVGAKRGVPAFCRVAKERSDLVVRSRFKKMIGAQWAKSQLLGQMSGFVAVSRSIHRELLTAGIPEERVHYIPNGVDSRHFSPELFHSAHGARGNEEAPRPFNVLFVGALVRRKRPHLLLEALGILRAAGHEVRLLAIGPEVDAPYGRLLRDRAAALNVSEHVTFLGYQDNVLPHYRTADAFCLPSSEEGMSNSMLEAMSCALPVVVSDASGVEDVIVHERNGLIVEPSPEAFSRAVLELMLNEAIREKLGREARETICRNHAIETIYRRYAEMWKNRGNR